MATMRNASFKLTTYIDTDFPINQQHKDQDQQHKAYLNLMEHRLEFKTQQPQNGKISRPFIFKFIANLGRDYQHPHVVSIGPYHRGSYNLADFDQHKWYFLKKLLSRTNVKSSKDLGFFLKEMRGLEARTRGCYLSYGDEGPLCSYDFVEMMLLDGCFVIEQLRLLGKSEEKIDKLDDDDDLDFMTASAIPLLIADLVKLENQIPFFVLESLYICSTTSEHEKKLLPLIKDAIELVFPLPKVVEHKPLHLLELVYKNLMPKAYTTCSVHDKQKPHETIQFVTKLRPSGIKFKPRKSVGLLDIVFKNGVLEIPTIHINDFNMNLITNCLAWEQCTKDAFTYFSDYIYFMNCVINGPKDVALLCDDGVIIRHARDDASVVSFLNSLGKNIQVYNSGTSYLSREMNGIEAYYSSSWPTIMRTLSVNNSPALHSSMPSLFS